MKRTQLIKTVRTLFVLSLITGVFAVSASTTTRPLAAQDDAVATESTSDVSSDEEAELQAKYEKFEKLLAGAKLVGTFTIKGREDRDPQVEEYTISEVSKLPRGDYWQFKARIKYANNDYELPIPLEVKWADDTPMISLTDLTFLGQGPFSARILFYDGMYAGTWSHGEVGGHMFGRIEKGEETKEDE